MSRPIPIPWRCSGCFWWCKQTEASNIVMYSSPVGKSLVTKGNAWTYSHHSLVPSCSSICHQRLGEPGFLSDLPPSQLRAVTLKSSQCVVKLPLTLVARETERRLCSPARWWWWQDPAAGPPHLSDCSLLASCHVRWLSTASQFYLWRKPQWQSKLVKKFIYLFSFAGWGWGRWGREKRSMDGTAMEAGSCQGLSVHTSRSLRAEFLLPNKIIYCAERNGFPDNGLLKLQLTH